MDGLSSSVLSEKLNLELEDVEKNIDQKIKEDDITYKEATVHLVQLSVPS